MAFESQATPLTQHKLTEAPLKASAAKTTGFYLPTDLVQGYGFTPGRAGHLLSSFCPALCCQRKNSQMLWNPSTHSPLTGWKRTLGVTG